MNNNTMNILAIIVALAILYNYLQINIFSILIIAIGIFVLFYIKYDFKKNPIFFRGLVYVLLLSVVYSIFNTILTNLDIPKSEYNFLVKVISDKILTLNNIELSIRDISSNWSFLKSRNNVAVILSLVLLLLFYIDLVTTTTETEGKPNHLPILFFERKRDLNRLIEVFPAFNVIGVVGDWGTGKTLLTKHLELALKDKSWNFIRINALALKLDKVELLVITELEKLLEDNGIISKHAKNLKNALGSSDVVKGIYFSIFSSELYADAIIGLKDDIVENNIKVTIVVEDLDRVNEFQVIDNLFTISNVLQNDSLKFIFEYNYIRLNLLNRKFDREYLDKYVYTEVFVSPVKFSWLLTRLINKTNHSFIETDGFNFLNYPVTISEVNTTLNMTFEREHKLNDQPVRKMEHLLENINVYLSILNKNNIKDFNSRAVIVFYILKFFYQETWYRLMGNFTNVIDSFTFKVFNIDNSIKEEVTLREILMRVRNYRYINSLKDKDKLPNLKVLSENEAYSILNDNRNMLSFCVIGWLQYNVLSVNEGRTYAYADERELKKLAYNEDVDAILRNLMWGGKNSVADIKLVIDNLNREVFQDKNINNWPGRYSKFLEGYFYSKFPMEQGSERTPFVIGINPIVTLFQCMSMYIGDYRDWYSLIKLLFIEIEDKQKHNIKVAWQDIMKCLSISDYDSAKTVRFVITEFNKLDIVYNPKEDANYWKFLEKIIVYFSSFGASQFFGYYAQQLTYFDPGMRKRDIDGIIENILEPIKLFFKEAEEMSHEINSNDRENRDSILFMTFIENNIHMLQLEMHNDVEPSISCQVIEQVKKSEEALRTIRDKKYESYEDLKKALIEANDCGEIKYYDAISIVRAWKRDNKNNS